VLLLDPSNRCSHRWIRFSEETAGLSGRIGGEPNVAIPPAIIEESDFEAFLHERPRILVELPSKIRQAFREREYIVRKWLGAEYDEWKKSQVGHDTPGETAAGSDRG
jgi:hypothetical protein